MECNYLYKKSCNRPSFTTLLTVAVNTWLIWVLPFLILGLHIYRNIKQERRLLKGIEVIEDQVLTSFIRGQIDELKHEEEEG